VRFPLGSPRAARVGAVILLQCNIYIAAGDSRGGREAPQGELETRQGRAMQTLRRPAMNEPLPDGGTIRKLWVGERDAYRDHLLRLDGESRHRRFSGAVSDEFIERYAATAFEPGAVLHGFFVDGSLRGVAELRRLGPLFAREGEAAFSIEQPWQSQGVGSVLLERTLLSARNRGIKSLHMHCLADNRRMQQLARKFEADLHFDFGSVVGEVDPPRYTALSLMREAFVDAHGVANAMLEAQARLVRAA
jgi:GNAT superfamily N-acetyltransferase